MTPRLASIVVAAALIALAPAAGATAAPAPPADLEVVDGGGWRPDRRFGVRWTNPSGAGPPIAAVHYLVRDPLGTVAIGPERVDWPTHRIESISVPGDAGLYTAEVWLEDSGAAPGPPAAVKLRFDPIAPGPAQPLQTPGWIGDSELPHAVLLAHPPGSAPPSGIRGYAVSVDRDPDGSPCLAADRCTDAETDLRGGPGDDSLLVAELPEGVSYVHAVAVSGAGLRSPLARHATLRVDRTDPSTRLLGEPAGWTNRTVVLRAIATDAASGMESSGDGSPFTAIQVDDAAPSIVAGDSAGATVISSGVHAVSYYARDAAGNVNDGRPSNGHRNADPALALIRIDRAPPAVFPIGSKGPGDPELIEARVSDPLSGPDPHRGSIAVRAVGSGRSFEALPTVVLGSTLRARWNSDDHPPGEYEFRATGFDVAGNSASGTRRPNGSPLVLSSPLKVAARLSAALGSPERDERVVEFGRGAVLNGALELASGAPAEGMPIRVVEHFEPGAAIAARSTEVLTGAGGAFSLHLPPGPNRVVVAQFAGTRATTRAYSQPARLLVRSGVRLRSSSPAASVGGRPVVFRGEMSSVSGEQPAAGVSVQLQFRLPGLPWTEFRTVQTDRRGRFRYPYRFSDDDSRGVRFLFRAFVPTQSDWPYEPGGSRPVAVRGA